MRVTWSLPLAFLSLLPACAHAAAAAPFENTAIVRTVEPGGALAHVTTTYAVRALGDGVQTYTFALTPDEDARTSWIEARLKGAKLRLPLTRAGLHSTSEAVLYEVELPKPLAKDGITSLVLESVQAHASFPWPKEAKQSDDQLLKYETDLFVVSPYKTAVQRTKIKAPSPRVPTYSTPSNVGSFTKDKDAPSTKSGTTVTFGPFYDLPATADPEFARAHQQKVAVQYGYDHPVLEVRTLRRAAEISHWGANINIQDEIDLHNGGPTLEGHFSRLEHQTQSFYKKTSPHTMRELTLHLPADIRDAYYYDLVGNVSTSHLRVPPAGRFSVTQQSVLELRPRYPLLGGWNFSFTLGWDAPLANSAVFDKATGRYVVGVPVMTLVPGAVVDDVEVKVILPEGATDVEVFPPFPPKSMTRSTHVTYLDTVGRPAVTFVYESLTDKHQGIIYVSYKVPVSAHLKKPFAVAVAFFSVFVFGLGARRVDLSLYKK